MTKREYKGYMVEHLGTFPMVEIKMKGQGAVPKRLAGLFTTEAEAFRHIDGYLSSLKKGRNNGKAKTAG